MLVTLFVQLLPGLVYAQTETIKLLSDDQSLTLSHFRVERGDSTHLRLQKDHTQTSLCSGSTPCHCFGELQPVSAYEEPGGCLFEFQTHDGQIEMVAMSKNQIYANATAAPSAASKHHYSTFLSHARMIQTTTVVDTDMESTLKVSDLATLKWKFNSDDTFDMIFSWNRDSWCGLGFGKDMSNVDMLTFNLVNQAVVVQDLWSTGQITPSTDQSQDIQTLQAEKTTPGFKIRFRRKLNTGDKEDAVLKQGDQYTWSLAYSSGQSLAQHSSTDRGTFPVSFIKGVNSQVGLEVGINTLLYVHAIILFIAWGVVADVAILVVRFAKTWKHYMLFHTLCFVFTDFATIILVIIMLVMTEEGEETTPRRLHTILGILILAVVVAQHTMGIIIKTLLEQKGKKNNEIALSIRKGHAIVGTIIFLIAKIELNVGFNLNGNTLLFNLNLAWNILTIVFRIGMTLYGRSQSKIKSKVDPENQPLLLNDQQKLLELLNQRRPVSEILKALPNLAWVTLNNDVYDLTGMQHPGGNFIISNVIGREVSRFFFGAYGLEVTNMEPYAHSQKAYELLQKLYIGTVASAQGGEKPASNEWEIASQEKLSDQIFLYTFEQENKVTIKLDQNASDFGRHYSVTLQAIGGKVRMYTKVLSASKPCRDYRKQLLEYFEGTVKEVPKLVQQDSHALPLIIKKYNYNDALSNQLVDYQGTVYIEGPFGQGLELSPNQQCAAFVGGTGLLPFMDLLDHLLLKAVYHSMKAKNNPDAEKVFQKDDQLGPNFSLTVYASFLNEKEFVGKEWIRELYRICQSNGLKFFDMRIRYSDPNAKDPVIPQFQNRFDQKFVMGELRDLQKQVYICGPPQMNHSMATILQQLNYDQEKVIIV